MKAGLLPGAAAATEFVVTESQCPVLGGQMVHRCLGTAALVTELEWAARQVILPFLEEHEEGMGTGLRVRHLQPAAVGQRVQVTARCLSVRPGDVAIVVCAVRAQSDRGLIAKGTVTQALLPKARIVARIGGGTSSGTVEWLSHHQDVRAKPD